MKNNHDNNTDSVKYLITIHPPTLTADSWESTAAAMKPIKKAHF